MGKLSLKDKIEMYEKELNFLFKELITYFMIIGAVFAFVIQNFQLKIDKNELKAILQNDIYLIIISYSWTLLIIAIIKFVLWVNKTLKRIKELKEKIKRLNNEIDAW